MQIEFYKRTEVLDALKIKSSLTVKEQRSLLHQLDSLSLFRYFFNNLKNPLFVLYKSIRKFMSVSLSDKDTNRSFYIGEYLKRIAQKNSVNVYDIILGSKPKDSRVNRTLLEIILLLDIRYAAKLAHFCVNHLIGKGLAEGKIINDLIVKYLEGGKRGEALLIFNFIMEPVVRSVIQPLFKEHRTIKSKEAVGQLEGYEYKELLEGAFPRLLETQLQKVIRILEQNLMTAVEIESKRTKSGRKEDLSYIWRPAIEEHEQNYKFGDIKELLVSTLRNSLMLAADKDNDEFLRPLLQRYLRSRYAIFRRIALYIIGENVERYSDFISTVVMNEKMLEDYRIRHELYSLIRKSFPQLGGEGQQFILDWIDKGPEPKRWVDWQTKEDGKRPSDERTKQFENHWRLERYWIIRDYIKDLYPERTKIIDQLEKEFGTPEHPDFSTWHEGGTYGYESPLNVAEFLQKSDDELIEILKNPPPVKEHNPIFEHHGLGMVFVEAIKQSPERFLPFADRLASNKVVPVLVGHYFHGLREVWEIPKDNWKPVWSTELETLALLVAKTESNPYQWTVDERSRVRLNLCRFIESVISNRDQELDDSVLTSIKGLLIAMIGDPDPNESSEEQNYSTNKDWSFISLNHTSGEVLRTLVKYCLCYARKHPVVGERFESDVKTELERVLDMETRPSVFSVFGTYLANLWYLDAEWTKKNLHKIFPKENRLKYDAAWDAYLKFNNVYKDVYDSLKQYYLETITSGIKQGKIKDFGSERLAQHLSLVYWRGWEDITAKDSTVAAFFTKVSLNLRVDFVRQIGMGLREMKKTGELEKNPQAWERAKELWSHRIVKAKSAEGANRQEDELSAFLDWLSECPEDVAIMEKLISKSLRKWKAKYHSGATTEYLASQSIKYPLICIRLLNDIFKRPSDKSYYYFDDKEVRQVMENAVNAGGETAKIAGKLASKLGEYGYFGFKDIWDKVNTKS
jgi:hypothetical protein